jgi:hypothetical protein
MLLLSWHHAAAREVVELEAEAGMSHHAFEKVPDWSSAAA